MQPIGPEVHSFTKKVFEKSGIDNNGSYLPKNLHPQYTSDPKGGVEESYAEARIVMGGAAEEVLRKTGKCMVQGTSRALVPEQLEVLQYSCIVGRTLVGNRLWNPMKVSALCQVLHSPCTLPHCTQPSIE